MDRQITMEDIKRDYAVKTRTIEALEADINRLTERNSRLQAYKNQHNARRLELIDGKRETRKHAERRQWWCGIAMGLWIAVWIKFALWAFGM